jgi:hypothetical protein
MYRLAGLIAVVAMMVIAPSTALGASAAVLGPLNSSSVSSPAASHLISYGGDWAMDIAGSGDVYVRLSSSAGVSLRVEQISAACGGGRQGGTAVRVRAYLNGASVALLVYSHLADVAVGVGQNIGNGTRLGRAATGLPYDETCWTGPHVHFEARNDSGYACYTPLGSGAGVGAGTAMGQIGAVGGTRLRFPCGSPPPPAGANPLGHYDEASSPEAGKIRVRGWSFDPDARTATTEMHIYVGGQAGQPGTEGRAFAANGHRPDVNAVHGGVGDWHGLDVTFETGKRGATPVCLYAITIGGGNNVLLGCKTVTVGAPEPIGSFDALDSPVGGTVRVRGWTFDPNARTSAASVHVYIGGPYGKAGVEGPKVITANQSRPDVGAAFPGAGNAHGINHRLTTAKRGRTEVCVYTINVGPGSNVLLGCKTVTIAAPPPPPPKPTPTPVPQPQTPPPPPTPVAPPTLNLGTPTDPAFQWTSSNRVRARRAVNLDFACHKWACRVAVRARIRIPRRSRTYRSSDAMTLESPGHGRLRLTLSRSGLRDVRRALAARRTVRASLTVTLSDLPGTTVTFRRTLTFRR